MKRVAPVDEYAGSDTRPPLGELPDQTFDLGVRCAAGVCDDHGSVGEECKLGRCTRQLHIDAVDHDRVGFSHELGELVDVLPQRGYQREFVVQRHFVPQRQQAQ